MIIQDRPETEIRFLEDFAKKNELTTLQIEQLREYALLILEWNKKFNLTAKNSFNSIFRDLFQDALIFFRHFDKESLRSIADVGTGSGIPGLVLKIANPSMSLTLIEVNKKKISFLEHVIKSFDLQNVQIVDLDWRTFNRKTELDIDLFVTKAAFDDSEIVRMFRQNCFYINKKLVYWASFEFEPKEENLKFIEAEFPYSCDGRKRRFIVFSDFRNRAKQD